MAFFIRLTAQGLQTSQMFHGFFYSFNSLGSSDESDENYPNIGKTGAVYVAFRYDLLPW